MRRTNGEVTMDPIKRKMEEADVASFGNMNVKVTWGRYQK